MYDLRVEVAEIRGFCDLPHRVGDWFEVRNGRLHIPDGKYVCIWALGSLLPMLPAKERRVAESNDWLPRVQLLTCPDPNGLVIWRITQIPRRESEGLSLRDDQSGPAENVTVSGVETASGRLAINRELCTGCGECVSACPLTPVRVRLPGPEVCCQCGVAKCVEACSRGALRRGRGGRTVEVDPVLCDGCGSCAQACAFGGPLIEDAQAWFCDLCGGDPRCASACKNGAIAYLSGT